MARDLSNLFSRDLLHWYLGHARSTWWLLCSCAVCLSVGTSRGAGFDSLRPVHYWRGKAPLLGIAARPVRNSIAQDLSKALPGPQGDRCAQDPSTAHGARGKFHAG